MSAPSVRPSGRLRRTATRAWASDRLLALLVALMLPTLIALDAWTLAALGGIVAAAGAAGVGVGAGRAEAMVAAF